MKLVTTCAAALSVLALAACGEDVVSKDDVESQASTVIEKEVGQKPKSITCPDDLKAKVGETMKCELTAPDDSKVDVTVKVTSASDGEAKFSVEVGDEVRR